MAWQNILLSILSVILTALVSWGAERLIALINTKIKNTKYAKYLTSAVDVVTCAVKATYQTYVESLKNDSLFTQEAQTNAIIKAKDMALSQMSEGVRNYIADNFGDIESWITNTIESVIYDLKK